MDMCAQSPVAVSDVQAQRIPPELKLHFDLDWNLGTVVLELCL